MCDGIGLSSATTLLSGLSLVTVLPRLKCLCTLHGDFVAFFVVYFETGKLTAVQKINLILSSVFPSAELTQS